MKIKKCIEEENFQSRKSKVIIYQKFSSEKKIIQIRRLKVFQYDKMSQWY